LPFQICQCLCTIHMNRTVLIPFYICHALPTVTL
jgi:hypothetical protein